MSAVLQPLVLAAFAAAAYFARRVVEHVDVLARAVVRLEEQLTGGEGGMGGLRQEVREIREVMRTQAQESHTRLAEWTVWRTRKDASDQERDRTIAGHGERIYALEGAPQRRTTRRRQEDR